MESPPVFLGGGDSYKIDYSIVAVKSRCVAEIVKIAFIINKLCWSGREDSNLRPSAPKADALPGCATPRRSNFDCIADRFPSGLRDHPATSFDATIDRLHGGYSSAAERLTVAQDVVGSIPTSRPKCTERNR